MTVFRFFFFPQSKCSTNVFTSLPWLHCCLFGLQCCLCLPQRLPARSEGKLGRPCLEMSELGMVALVSRSKKPSSSPLHSRQEAQPALEGCVVSWHGNCDSAPW